MFIHKCKPDVFCVTAIYPWLRNEIDQKFWDFSHYSFLLWGFGHFPKHLWFLYLYLYIYIYIYLKKNVYFLITYIYTYIHAYFQLKIPTISSEKRTPFCLKESNCTNELQETQMVWTNLHGQLQTWGSHGTGRLPFERGKVWMRFMVISSTSVKGKKMLVIDDDWWWLWFLGDSRPGEISLK